MTASRSITLAVPCALAALHASPALAQSQIAKLLPSDGAAGDLFGNAVAIDAGTALIGAIFDDDACPADPSCNSGAAYIFDARETGTEKLKLTARNPSSSDKFGVSVDISADHAIVGAFTDDEAAFDAGAAYIFGRNEGGPDNWGLVTKLFAADAEVQDHFGGRVAIDADTAVVGAVRDDDACPSDPLCESGAAYVFHRDAGGLDNWGQVAKLTASDAEAQDQFGVGVAIHADTIVVGAWFEDSACPADPNCNSGSAYVFMRDAGGTDQWGQVAKLTASDGDAGDLYAFSVAVSGQTVLVGATRDDDACPTDPDCDSGAAYVYRRNHTGPDAWGEVTKITASDAEPGDIFGIAVALDGNVGVVGARQDDDLCPTDPDCDSGSAYLFAANSGAPGGWGQLAKLTPSDPAAGAFFGEAVAVDGDLALIGADRDDDNGIQSGSAYTFDGIVLDPLQDDCNANSENDLIEVIGGAAPDCNCNFVPDACDIASGFSLDVNPADGIPDECQPPCSGDLDGDDDTDVFDFGLFAADFGCGTNP